MIEAETVLVASAAVAASVVGATLTSSLLRRHVFVPKFTVLADLTNLGEPRRYGKISGRAVICGGSIAGLFAATVCADNYEEVLIVEPEVWLHTEEGTILPEATATRVASEDFVTPVNKRTRVVQYHFTHVTQPISLLALRALFPDFDEESAAIGGRPAIADFHTHISGQLLKAPFNYKDFKGPPVESIFLSRQAYETLLRRLVKKYRPNVSFLAGTVTGLEFSGSQSNMVNGVCVRTENGVNLSEHADLVVDATGATQVGFSKWLRPRGIAASLRIQYDPNVYLTAATFYIPSHLRSRLPIPGGFSDPRWLLTHLPDTTIENQGIIIGIVENSKLMMTYGGWRNAERPHEPSAIKRYLESLHSHVPMPPWVLALMDTLQAHIDELNATYSDLKLPPCNYVRYHDAPAGSVPSNFVAIGDSVMKINPIFAQGMAKACIGAVTLDKLLRQELHQSRPFPTDFSVKYFAAHAARIKSIWTQAKATDYGFETTNPAEGESLDEGAETRAFARYLMTSSLEDRELSSTLYNVRMFLAPMTDIFSLGFVLRAGWRWMFG